MIKVNLQNTAVQNMLTGQNTLDSVFIDGNSILFIEKPEYLKQLYRDDQSQSNQSQPEGGKGRNPQEDSG